MKRGSYRTFAELKSVFGNVDKVGNVFVFNIGGNEVRLIAAIHFCQRMCSCPEAQAR